MTIPHVLSAGNFATTQQIMSKDLKQTTMPLGLKNIPVRFHAYWSPRAKHMVLSSYLDAKRSTVKYLRSWKIGEMSWLINTWWFPEISGKDIIMCLIAFISRTLMCNLEPLWTIFPVPLRLHSVLSIQIAKPPWKSVCPVGHIWVCLMDSSTRGDDGQPVPWPGALLDHSFGHSYGRGNNLGALHHWKTS